MALQTDTVRPTLAIYARNLALLVFAIVTLSLFTQGAGWIADGAWWELEWLTAVSALFYVACALTYRTATRAVRRTR